MRISRRAFARLSLASGLATLLGACRRSAEVPAPPALPVEARSPGAGGPQRYREAPMLAEQVARGDLPPVDERLPEAPYVLQVNGEIGTHGGAWRRAYRQDSPTGSPNLLRAKNGLTHLGRDLALKPYIAESWELDETRGTITWHLRRGMRWSNGDPVTSEDFCFHWLAGLDYPEIGHSGLEHKVQIEVSDDYTFSLWLGGPSAPQAQPITYADQLGYELPLAPSAFARGYHPDYVAGGRQALEALARQEGYADWATMYRARVLQSSYYYGEPNKPTLLPWRAITRRGTSPTAFERNPYFWQVDAQGQQLPYLDHVLCLPVGGEEPLEMRVQNGELDYQVEGLLPQREEAYRLAGYHVQHYPSGEHIVLQFDLSSPNRALAGMVSHLEARQALSLAINRDQLSALYDGLAKPRQYSPIKSSPLYDEEAASQYLEYDPVRAGAILDRLGYGNRDEEGYRVSPERERLRVMLQSPYEPESVGGRMVAAVLVDLEAVGLECTLLERPVATIYENHRRRALDACITPLGGTLLPSVVVVGGFSTIGRANVWQGTDAVPEEHYIAALDELYQQAILQPDLERKNSLFREFLQIWKRELPLVGLLGGFAQVGLVKEGLANILDGLVYDQVTNYEAVQNPQQFYWSSSQRHSLTREELASLTLAGASAAAPE